MNLSDVSDVNPEEMIKMVEDMDDLDNDLFGSLVKQKSPAMEIKESVIQSSSNFKKKVTFHDFDEDDPLADLLSDEDFQQKPKSTSMKTKSSMMSDLFGIQSTDPPVSNHNSSTEPSKSSSTLQKAEGTNPKIASKNGDWLGLMDESSINIQKESTEQKIVPKVRSILDSNEDGIANLTDKPSSIGDRAKKSSLMEDLFGNRPRSTPSMEFNVRVDSVKRELEKPLVQPKLEQSKTEQSVQSLGTEYVPTASAPREPRRGRRSPGIGNDPLGIINSLSSARSVEASQITEEDGRFIGDTRIKSTYKEDLPEWLDGPKKPKEEKSQGEKLVFSQSTKLGEESPGAPVSNTDILVTRDIERTERSASVPQTSMERTLNYPEHVSMLIGTQFDQQAAIMSLQQQEHELRTATTLSRQSEQLSHLLENQKVRLGEQEKQFNLLIKRQIDRQALLESQMKVQQERIDRYIQALMAQPTSVPIPINTNDSWNKATDERIEREVESENLVQKLQLEKLYLENTLDSLREKHEREIVIIEESYKKQITFLQEAMEKLEKRMYHDAERVEADYEVKIQKLKSEKTNVEMIYTEEIENLKKEHMRSLQEIHDRQHHNIVLLQKEHAETIENISKAKELERHAVGLTITHGTDLANMLQKAQVVIDGIQNLQKRIEDKDDKTEETKLNYLKKQEENIELLKEYLKRQEDDLIIERKQLIEATQKLEGGTLRLVSESKRRNEQNDEMEERLKMREQALIRDRELLNGQVQWEHSHLQMMREAWIKEQERQTRQLMEERELVTAERAKLEVLNRLKIGADDTVKVELEAALKAAQDATNNVNVEKQRWKKKFNELELQQQFLNEKENQLVLRAKELEDLTQSALEKRDEGLRALREARRIEEQHKERLGQLQMQLESLAQRENKIATEKVALARERLALRMSQAERPEKDTGKIGTPYNRTDNSSRCESQIPFNVQTTTHFKDIVDPKLVLLKLNLDNKLDTTNECLAAMRMINE